MKGLCELIDADAWAWSLVNMNPGERPRQVMMTYDGISDEALSHYLSAIEHSDMKWVLGSPVNRVITHGSPMGNHDEQIFGKSWEEIDKSPGVQH